MQNEYTFISEVVNLLIDVENTFLRLDIGVMGKDDSEDELLQWYKRWLSLMP